MMIRNQNIHLSLFSVLGMEFLKCFLVYFVYFVIFCILFCISPGLFLFLVLLLLEAICFAHCVETQYGKFIAPDVQNHDKCLV